MRSNPSRATNVPFLNNLKTATSIRFATEWLLREAEHRRYDLFNAKTISICYDFLAVSKAFGSALLLFTTLSCQKCVRHIL
jgi:hypothetical protein